ncbi:MAG: ABC transporter ATP-binding protein, partial [Verrucomicrobiota bacterium]
KTCRLVEAFGEAFNEALVEAFHEPFDEALASIEAFDEALVGAFAGIVKIGNEVVASRQIWIPPEKRDVGLVFQDGALFPHLTAFQNIAYGLKRLGADARRERVDSLLDLVGLGSYGKRFPHELSGGERQRLAVARALAPEPKVILLDEPFSNLDPTLRRSIREEIRKILRKVEATAILVTHDTDDALAIGDRIAIMRDGQIEQVGTAAEIYHKPTSGYCASLFGTANEMEPDRWLRPDELTISSKPVEGAIEVNVEIVRDVGRCFEVFVKPAAAEGKSWIVETDQSEFGEKGWVSF